MDRPIRIGIDVDDIVNDFFPHWIEEWNKYSGDDIHYLDVFDWDLRKLFPDGTKYKEFLKIPENPDFYNELKVDKLSQVVISELVDAGAEVFFITGTYANCIKYKEEWILKHFPNFPMKNILYVKAENKNLVNVDVMIDDCPIGLDKFQTATVLLYDKNYNIHVNFPNNANIHRVNSWLDIRDIFVEKFDLLPKTSEKLSEYNKQFEGIEDDLFEDEEVEDSLYSKLVNCNTKEDYNNLLAPYFKKIFDAGYSSALGDIAKYMRELNNFDE